MSLLIKWQTYPFKSPETNPSCGHAYVSAKSIMVYHSAATNASKHNWCSLMSLCGITHFLLPTRSDSDEINMPPPETSDSSEERPSATSEDVSKKPAAKENASSGGMAAASATSTAQSSTTSSSPSSAQSSKKRKEHHEHNGQFSFREPFLDKVRCTRCIACGTWPTVC